MTDDQRHTQEADFVALVRPLQKGFDPDVIDGLPDMAKGVVRLFEQGFEPMRPFDRENVRALTPMGLFTMLMTGVSEGVAASQDSVSIVKRKLARQACDGAFNQVWEAALDASPQVRMTRNPGDEDWGHLGQVSSFFGLGSPALVARCMAGGMELDAKALDSLAFEPMLALVSHPDIHAAVLAMPEPPDCLRQFSFLPNLTLRNEEELSLMLNGPARRWVPAESVDLGFHAACIEGHSLEKIKLWRKAGGSLEGVGCDSGKLTPLVEAIKLLPEADMAKPDPLVVLMMMQSGADAAAMEQVMDPGKKQRAVVQWLLDEGANPNPTDLKSALSMALERGNAEIIDAVQAKGGVLVDDQERLSTWIGCAKEGSVEGLHRMLDEGMPIETVVKRYSIHPMSQTAVEDEDTALVAAAMWDRPEAVAFLLEQGANPNTKVSRFLIEGTSGQQRNVTFLQEAVRMDMPKVLVAAGETMGEDVIDNLSLPSSAKKCLAWRAGKKAKQELDSIGQDDALVFNASKTPTP